MIVGRSVSSRPMSIITQTIVPKKATASGGEAFAAGNPAPSGWRADMFVTYAAPNVRRLEARAQLTRYGGDCYIYAMLAMGLVDVATDPGLNPYDIQALIPIIRGAGGLVTRWDGGNPCAGGAVIACGSPALLGECLAELGR